MLHERSDRPRTLSLRPLPTAHDLSGLRELLTLDVSHNRLREVSAGSFRHLRHLQRLHLQHNHLTTLDARDLAALTPRTHAILHHNPWACTCSLLTALQQLQNCATCQHQVRFASARGGEGGRLCSCHFPARRYGC